MAASADAIQTAEPSSNAGTTTRMEVTNYGIIQAGDGQAIDWLDGRGGSPSTLTNHSTGEIIADDSDAVRLGLSGSVTNYGLIRGSGGHGITADDTWYPYAYVWISNEGDIEGLDGNGIDMDGAGVFGAIINEGLISGSSASDDADGIDVDGAIELLNSGDITGSGNINEHEGVASGGGFITNYGSISGDTNGIKMDDGAGGAASTWSSISNYGYIGGGSYAIRLFGTLNDTVLISEDYGTAEFDGTVDLGPGNDTITVDGRAANIAINGSVAGGTGSDTIVFDVPTGQSFTINFAHSGLEHLVKNGGGTLYLNGSTSWTSLTINAGTVSF